ncbi:MAG: DNA-formamidopyrimidine glycosylase family protein [Fimbriimonas sp.]
MPELPEVEAVRRLMERVLVGKRIIAAEAAPDAIVLKSTPPEAIESALIGRTVKGVGRKGKYWWLEVDEHPWLFGHLGMSGWIQHIGKDTIKLKSHAKKQKLDEGGRPRFLKLLITVEGGDQIAFTDGRRLGRIWLANSPQEDRAISKLGFDCLSELPTGAKLHEKLKKRKAPIKAVLLDQGLFAGVGNWIADETLYQSKIAPNRLANGLSLEETKALRSALAKILRVAVAADADFNQFPKTWLFHHRWGGDRGQDRIAGQDIIRETIGGRTTAWVPARQR